MISLVRGRRSLHSSDDDLSPGPRYVCCVDLSALVTGTIFPETAISADSGSLYAIHLEPVGAGLLARFARFERGKKGGFGERPMVRLCQGGALGFW